MKDFELSIKPTPGGVAVKVKGTRWDIIFYFALLAVTISRRTDLPLDLLAATISRRTDLPLDLLAAAVQAADELEAKIVDEEIAFDMEKLRHAGEK